MKEVTPKEAFNKFKPESCVFVISVDDDGKPSGMIAGWQMKCSIDPPLFAVALSKRGHTHKLIRKSKEFVIAVANKGLEKHVKLFGSTHGEKVDKFKESGIRTAEAKVISPPLLIEATINLECIVEKEVNAGDHLIFIGRIVASHMDNQKKVLLNMGAVNGNRVFKEF